MARVTHFQELTDDEVLALGPDDFFHDELDRESFERLNRVYIAAQKPRWWRFMWYTDQDAAELEKNIKSAE